MTKLQKALDLLTKETEETNKIYDLISYEIKLMEAALNELMLIVVEYKIDSGVNNSFLDRNPTLHWRNGRVQYQDDHLELKPLIEHKKACRICCWGSFADFLLYCRVENKQFLDSITGNKEKSYEG